MRSILVILLSLTFAEVGAQDTTRLSLLFIGDIMQHDSQIAAARIEESGGYDYTSCFAGVKDVFESYDLAIGNLELTLGGPPYRGYPTFSAPDAIATTLKNSGIDVLVTANNHCLDKGKKGLQRTIRILDSLQIPHTGTFVDSVQRADLYPLVIEKNGFRLSLLNYTYGTNGILVTKPNIVNYIDTVAIAKDIAKAKEQNTDAIILFVHWGDEYQRLPNKSQKMLTEFCFAKGVKLMIGAHPHVIQPMEWRKETDQFVVYSLGNFVSGQTSRYKNGGVMVGIDLIKVVSDSTSKTSIADIDYRLQFVYRDQQKKFYVLPVQEYEDDTVFVRSPAMKSLMTEFAQDSRQLLATHNLNVKEHQLEEPGFYLVADSLLDISSLDSLARQRIDFYGIRQELIDGTEQTVIGEFYDKAVAEAAMNQLALDPGIVTRLQRRRKNSR